MTSDSEKIAKVLASRGLCSRRDAEKLVAAGKVKVEGQLITTPATRIAPDATIAVEGKLLAPKQEVRIWLLNKPAGVITTNKDPQGRTTVFDILPKEMPRVISVGRLDLNTEGLLILTNDGELARILELPSSHINRTYKVRVFGRLNQNILQRISSGISIDGVHYGKIQVEYEGAFASTSTNYWLKASLQEGKNREIRNVFEYFDLQVNRLIRISYGIFELQKLAPTHITEVPKSIVTKLLEELQKRK